MKCIKQGDISKHDITIVLTGTIKPMIQDVKYIDEKKRRGEYLDALRYYSKYGNVVFLENSDYDITKDKDFFLINNVSIYKMKIDSSHKENAGYHEFKMIDEWVNNCHYVPKRWIKITGRYIIKNFYILLNQCLHSSEELIMDVDRRKHYAYTFLFFVTTSFYKKFFMGIYALSKKWIAIEQVIYIELHSNYLNVSEADRSIFKKNPLFEVTYGVAGLKHKMESPLINGIINFARCINCKLYKRDILYYSVVSPIIDMYNLLKK